MRLGPKLLRSALPLPWLSLAPVGSSWKALGIGCLLRPSVLPGALGRMLICTLTYSGWTWGLLCGWGLRGCGFLLHGAEVHGLGFLSSLHVSEGTCGHKPQEIMRCFWIRPPWFPNGHTRSALVPG